ncbi:MAG: hypothetical protein AB1416_08640 [Actinomycetota bacterium]
MRQIIRFEAVNFDFAPVEVEVPEGEEPPADGTVPVGLLLFDGGSVQVQVAVTEQDADGLLGAFTQAEPHRASLPEGHGWEPVPAELPGRVFWVLTPAVVGVSVTPPQATDEGLIPFWQLAFDDQDGSQVQVAVSDAMCVQVVRALADIVNAAAGEPADA